MQARAPRIGVNIWVSTGNEVDLDVAALIAALANDGHTDVIACYLEGVRHAPTLMSALAAAHKPVILMKGGACPSEPRPPPIRRRLRDRTPLLTPRFAPTGSSAWTQPTDFWT